MYFTVPKNYNPVLSVRETQEAIKYLRDTFQKEFGKEMNLSQDGLAELLEVSRQ